MQNKPVEVTIFGQNYVLRGDVDEDKLRAMAAYLDNKMREMADKLQSPTYSKLAILASLNIISELFDYKEQLRNLEGIIKSIDYESDKVLELLKTPG